MSDARQGSMRILAIAQDFSRRNPSGSALLRLLNVLAAGHAVTCVGGSRRPAEMNARIRYVRAWRPARGGVLFGLAAFHLSHWLVCRWLTTVRRERFDVVQTIDSESLLGTVVTFHCCHAAYLATMEPLGLLNGPGWRGAAAAAYTRLIYRFRAAVERRVCRSARTAAIIALSDGSAADIVRHYAPRVPPAVVPNSIA